MKVDDWKHLLTLREGEELFKFKADFLFNITRKSHFKSRVGKGTVPWTKLTHSQKVL